VGPDLTGARLKCGERDGQVKYARPGNSQFGSQLDQSLAEALPGQPYPGIGVPNSLKVNHRLWR
jgi:hypothetical protein